MSESREQYRAFERKCSFCGTALRLSRLLDEHGDASAECPKCEQRNNFTVAPLIFGPDVDVVPTGSRWIADRLDRIAGLLEKMLEPQVVYQLGDYEQMAAGANKAFGASEMAAGMRAQLAESKNAPVGSHHECKGIRDMAGGVVSISLDRLTFGQAAAWWMKTALAGRASASPSVHGVAVLFCPWCGVKL